MSELITSYPESNYSSHETICSNNRQYAGSSIVGNGYELDSVTFYLRRTGSPTGNATVQIFAHDGTSKPTGSVLATSDGLNVAGVSTSFSLKSFAFSGENKIILQNGTKYFVLFFFDGGNLSNYIRFGKDNTAPTYDGDFAWSANSGSTWDNTTGSISIFYVYGTQVVPPTPTVGVKYPLPAFKRP